MWLLLWLFLLTLNSTITASNEEATEIAIPITETVGECLGLSATVRSELTGWAINELIEQNRQNEQANAKNKKVVALLGAATTTLSLVLVIGEIIKLWS